jgi:hypothetical protein
MNSRLVIFNLLYYLGTLTLYFQGRFDPSSSLGYGFYILGFWIISGIILVFLVVRKKIVINRLGDKVGLFLATPVIFLLTIVTGLSMTDKVESEWYPYKNGHRYKIVTYGYKSSKATMRKEIYKSQETLTKDNTSFNSIKWLRDSTWTYYSEEGDTLKIEKYSNDKRVE